MAKTGNSICGNLLFLNFFIKDQCKRIKCVIIFVYQTDHLGFIEYKEIAHMFKRYTL